LLEESVYLIDLWLTESKPIVFTGALRTPDMPGYDGTRNLRDALAVAASPAARDHGVLVVINSEIHAASDVTKVHTTALNAFRSPEAGHLGTVDGSSPRFTRRAVRSEHVVMASPTARVDLIKCYAGVSADLFRAVMGLAPAGTVLEGLGSGGVPPQLMPAIKEAIAAGIVVVGCIRCPEGSVDLRPPSHYHVAGYVYDLKDAGVVFSSQSGLKSRLKLLALLSAGASSEQIARRFEIGYVNRPQ